MIEYKHVDVKSVEPRLLKEPMYVNLQRINEHFSRARSGGVEDSIVSSVLPSDKPMIVPGIENLVEHLSCNTYMGLIRNRNASKKSGSEKDSANKASYEGFYDGKKRLDHSKFGNGLRYACIQSVLLSYVDMVNDVRAFRKKSQKGRDYFISRMKSSGLESLYESTIIRKGASGGIRDFGLPVYDRCFKVVLGNDYRSRPHAENLEYCKTIDLNVGLSNNDIR